MKIKVSLIGYGLSGKSFHAPLLKALDDFEVCAIVTSRIDEAKSDFPDAEVCDIQRAIQISELVVIATPHQFHYEQALLALESNKHVVVEKPFTPRLDQAKELFKLAKSKGLVLGVFHNRRYDADFLTLKNIINNKNIGEVVTIESHFDRFRPEPKGDAWREKAGPQSGVWWDLGPHLVDQAVQLMGFPADIDFDVGTQRACEADDYFNVTFKYALGKRIHLRASCLVKDFGFRFRVHGTKGSVLFKTLDVQEGQLRSGMSANDEKFGLYPNSSFLKSEGIETQLMRGDYRKFYQEVASCIKSKSIFSVLENEVLFTTAVLLGNKNF